MTLIAVTCLLVLGTALVVDLKTHLLKDQYGRNRFYHGVNVVNKIAPFYPDTEVFNINSSLCEQDLINLRGWGMNIVRLHVAWEGVQPTRDFINETYILKLRDIVRMCNRYNISVLLDAHQDLFSRKFCGQGFPDWTVNRTTFPLPLTIKIRYDQHGYPLREDCQKIAFAKLYLTWDVMQFQQQFFSNRGGLADEFAKMWQQVARFMRYEPNLVGYEIINEPNGANAYRSVYNFLGPNNKFLLPFYKKVYTKIREADKNNLVFFEPSIFDVFGTGFLSTPGGPSDLDKQVLSYHLYCPLVTLQGQPTNANICHKFDDLTIQSKFANSKKIGIAGMLTQFGALSDSAKSAEEVLRITRSVESFFHSWIYWQFKYYNDVTTEANPPTTQSFYYANGSLQMNKIRALSHPYAYSVCGQLIESTFTAGSYRIVFKPGQCKAPTEIYINEPLYFPDSFTVRFSPACEDCHLQTIEKSYYKITTPQRLTFHTVTVDVIGHL